MMGKNIRVAILSVHTCPLAMLGGKKTGGMNVYVRDFSRELGRRGIHVDVFTRSQDDCVPHIVHDLGENGRVIHIPAGVEKPLPVPEVANHLDEFVANVIAFSEREGIEYDLIHSHYWLSGLVAEMLNEAWGKQLPIVQMFHTLGHMKNAIATSDAHRAPQSRVDGETHIIQSVADALIAATPAEYEQLLTLYEADAQNVVVIPPGVDPYRFHKISKTEAKTRLGLDHTRKNIVLAGRIEPLKGIDTLLEAIAMVGECCEDTLANVDVTIIGGDPWSDDPEPEMARLQQMREDLGITDLVTFVGSKDQMILPNYYASAEMVIMPSHYESFGLVALEAMMMGTPVIASEVGGLAHLVRDGVTGYHIPSRDAQALAKRIYELLSNESLLTEMSENAHQYAREFSWEHIVDHMVLVYEQLLGESAEISAGAFPFDSLVGVPSHE